MPDKCPGGGGGGGACAQLELTDPLYLGPLWNRLESGIMFLPGGKSTDSFPEQRLVIEPITRVSTVSLSPFLDPKVPCLQDIQGLAA